MNCADRALQPRQRILLTTKRAPDISPPPRNPSGPGLRRCRNALSARKSNLRAGSPRAARPRHCRSRPCRPAHLQRRIGNCRERSRARNRVALGLLQRPPSSLMPATSAFSASARASSFFFFAWPISFDAALRRACALQFRDHRAPRFVEHQQRRRQRLQAPPRTALVESVGVVADEFDVVHVCSVSHAL